MLTGTRLGIWGWVCERNQGEFGSCPLLKGRLPCLHRFDPFLRQLRYVKVGMEDELWGMDANDMDAGTLESLQLDSYLTHGWVDDCDLESTLMSSHICTAEVPT